MPPLQFTREQSDQLRQSWRAGAVPSCPVCNLDMSLTSVEPREGVPYVRRRDWLLCPGCKRSLILDRPRSDRADP